MWWSMNSDVAVELLISGTGLIVQLALLEILSTLVTPSTHLLSVSGLAWALTWGLSFGFGVLRSRAGIAGHEKVQDGTKRTHIWLAAASTTLAVLCTRVGRTGIWLQAFVPFTVYLIRDLDILYLMPSTTPERFSSNASPRNGYKTKGLLFFIGLFGSFTAFLPYTSSASRVLSICSVFFTSASLVLLETIFTPTSESANGISSRSNRASSSSASAVLFQVVSALSGPLALLLLVCSFFFEDMSLDALGAFYFSRGLFRGSWKPRSGGGFLLALGMGILCNSAKYLITLLLLQKPGRALHLGFVQFAGPFVTSIHSAATLFWALATLILSYVFFNQNSPLTSLVGSLADRGRMARPRQAGLLAAVAAFVLISLFILRGSGNVRISPSPEFPQDPNSFKPLPIVSDTSHPIQQLITKADNEFDALVARQSKTLAEAVAEYKRRYNLPPPPNFDKWFELAVSKNTVLIDEFDSVYHSLRPFWGVKPSTLRARTKEALGFDNFLIRLSIRNGEVAKIEEGAEWQRDATVGMLSSFVEHLPDMDLAFNTHDEPRVVIPSEDLARLVKHATDVTMPEAFANTAPKNRFSPRPSDMNDGNTFEKVTITRFNRFAHQATWTNSRISCAEDTPVRSLDENPADNAAVFATGSLGFIYNMSAQSDVCFSPSLKSQFGFFDRPNAFDVVHDLFPIFSQSKVSTFQDILYPSPWYWYKKVQYDARDDMDWDKKANDLFWRGSTTGGFSRDGGWKRQHRQRFVSILNAVDKATTLQPQSGGAWKEAEVARSSLKELINVHFSHIGQCDPGDCDAQRAFFDVTEPVAFKEAYAHRYVADVDGNAFSGRFYALLESSSLVFKQAIFREWHTDWLKPWVHFIPLSMHGKEWLEAVRFLATPDKTADTPFQKTGASNNMGPQLARRVAEKGSSWAKQTLRDVDMEVWFFRLLLEYGRVIDDNRASIGFVAEGL